MSKRYYTTAEAAAELGVTPARVRQMVLNSELEAEKFGRDLMIAAEALVPARSRKTTPGPQPKSQVKKQQTKKR
jgi:excisionase family DNA binding protein